MSQSTFKTDGGLPVNAFVNPNKVSKALAKLYIPVKETTTTANNGAFGKTIYDDGTPQGSILRRSANCVARIRDDNKRTMEMLSDVELAIKILCSSIVSPNDMGDTGFAYSFEDCDESTEVLQKMTEVVKTYMEDNYGLSGELEDMIRDLIAESGACVRAIIPENTLDALINDNDGSAVSVESLGKYFDDVTDLAPKQIGLIGAKDVEEVSIESLLDGSSASITYEPYSVSENITIYDNPDILRGPAIQEVLVKRHVRQRMGQVGYSLEAVETRKRRRKQKKQEEEHRQKTSAEPINLNVDERLKQKVQTKETNEAKPGNPHEIYGRPLVMRFPTESVIPVHRPNEPSKHIGYYVLLESKGTPLIIKPEETIYSKLRQRVDRNKTDGMSEAVKNVYNEMFQTGDKDSNDITTPKELLEAYRTKIEKNFVDAIQKGVYGEYGTISIPEEIMEMMFIRDMERRATKVLFLPSELVSFMALDYRDNGTGKTRLESGRIVYAMRALTMMANSMAAVRNSLRVKDIKLNIDKDDPNPEKTAEMMLEAYFKREGAQYPLGNFDAADLMDYVNYNGINVTYEGNPRLPQTNTEVTERNYSVAKVDTDYEQKLKERSIMTLGLPPTAVDDTIRADYATTIASSNLLVAKQVRNDQKVICRCYTDFLRKIIFNSGELRQSILDRFKEDKIKLKLEEGQSEMDYILELSEYMVMRLPEPNTSKIENQSKLLDSYSRMADIAIDAGLNRDGFGRELGPMENGLEAVRSAAKSILMRQFMQEQNIMPEISILTEKVDGKSALFEQWKGYGGVVLDNIKEMAQELGARTREAEREEQEILDKEDAKFNQTPEETPPDDTTGNEDPTTGDEPPADDNTDGDDDFNFDGDGTDGGEGDTPPAEDEPPVEEDETGTDDDTFNL